MNITILNNVFLKEDKTFDKEEAMKLCSKFAGVCYDKEGFNHINNEDKEKTLRRMNVTLDNGHHSVYDHIMINLNIENIPKILAMFLNNEKEYTTSEKSLRYTKISSNNNIISLKEEELYNKWVNIFNEIINIEYNQVLNSSKINKLSIENARYLTTVFIPTQMIYSTSLRQINYICSFMQRYIYESKNEFDKKISSYMIEFINKLDKLNILDERLMKNEKNRKLSLINNKNTYEDYFTEIYKTSYKGSFAQYAQAQRHRTLNYNFNLLNDFEYYIPPILNSYSNLTSEWKNDMEKVKDIYPQGQLVNINESGTYENFILKCKERLCSSAQLEIALQTKETLNKYINSLKEYNEEMYQDILNYSHGARCTFKDYRCSNDCKFLEGKRLTRKI